MPSTLSAVANDYGPAFVGTPTIDLTAEGVYDWLDAYGNKKSGGPAVLSNSGMGNTADDNLIYVTFTNGTSPSSGTNGHDIYASGGPATITANLGAGTWRVRFYICSHLPTSTVVSLGDSSASPVSLSLGNDHPTQVDASVTLASPTTVVLTQSGGLVRFTAITVAALTPDPPSAPTLTVISPVQIDVAVPSLGGNATSYNLQRAPDSSGSPGTYSTIGTGITVSATYHDTGRTPNTKYWYRLIGVNAAGSTNGAASSATTTNYAAPSIGTATSGNRAATITFTHSTDDAALGPFTYELFEGTTTGAEGGSPVMTGVTGTSFFRQGLIPGTKYFWEVKAKDGSGVYSPASGEVNCYASGQI